MPKGTEFVEEIIEIKSLNKYKIVSAFTGSFHSIFKTSEGKMVVCGGNNYGQLFIPPAGDIYNPVEVKMQQIRKSKNQLESPNQQHQQHLKQKRKYNQS